MPEQAPEAAENLPEEGVEDVVEVRSFAELNLSAETLAAIEEAGYVEPTPVQAQAIPTIMADPVDVVAQAQTGTGKTAAFTIPLVELLDPKGPPAQALILAPTRELAKQVTREFDTLGKGRGVTAFAVYGGVAFEPQIEALKRDHVIVATPGRLLDHLRKRNVDLQNLRYFVLDEADEMLSMGFEKEVSDIIRQLPAERRNLLFSATMPLAVVRFAENFISDAIRLDLSSDSVGATSVNHVYYQIQESARVAALRALLRSRTVIGAIIFANTKYETFKVQQILEEEGYSVGVLNGDLPQKQREQTLARLREESLDFLVATDIAARGIDISWLRSVINYDMPDQAESYIHRTGRTGRAGRVGTAYSLVTPGDVSVFHYLQKFFSLKMEKRTLPAREDIFAAQTDRAIQEWLAPLQDDSGIVYGQYLAVARRLGETEEGHRLIAKLIACYRDGAAVVETKGPDEETDATRRDEERRPRRDKRDETRSETSGDQKTSGDKPSAQDKQAEERLADDRKDRERDDRSADKRHAQARDDRQKQRNERPSDKREKRDERSSASRDTDSRRESSKSSEQAPREEKKQQPRSRSDDAKSRDAADKPHVSPTADEIRLWIYENSRGRNRWRSVKAIADALGLSEEEVDRICSGHKRLKRTSGKRQMWKVLKPYPPEEAQERLPAASSVEIGPPTSYVRIKINIGENLVSSPDELVNTMIQLAGFDQEDVGKAEVKAKHSIVQVSEAYWRDFIDALNNQQWKNTRLRLHKA